MLNSEHLCRVMDRAIPVIIVADRAVEHVVTEDPIEGQALRRRGPSRTGVNFHPCFNDGCAGPYQLSIHLDQTSVTGLNGTELLMITNGRDFAIASQEQINRRSSAFASTG